MGKIFSAFGREKAAPLKFRNVYKRYPLPLAFIVALHYNVRMKLNLTPEEKHLLRDFYSACKAFIPPEHQQVELYQNAAKAMVDSLKDREVEAPHVYGLLDLINRYVYACAEADDRFDSLNPTEMESLVKLRELSNRLHKELPIKFLV